MSNRSFILAVGLFAGFTALSSAQVPAPAGLWEFQNSGNLGLATLGNDLVPSGSGFTSVAGVAGDDTAVRVAIGSYYTMTHGIAPNGGGTKVNTWSILYDFRIPTGGVWYCFFQTNPFNLDDGEYFVRNTSRALGVGDLGYSTFTATAGTWYRLLITFGTSGSNTVYTAYINGTSIATQTAPTSLFLDQRFSLAPQLLVWADNDAEDNPMDVSNLAIWGQGLTASDATALGAAGDPVVAEIPPTTPRIDVSPGTWVEVGDRVEIAASLDGAVSYQWYKDNSIVGGETTAMLVIDPVGLGDAGEYFCRVDDGTKAEVDTDIITLEVFPAGTLPVAGIAGMAALLGGLAVGGMRLLRKRSSK